MRVGEELLGLVWVALWGVEQHPGQGRAQQTFGAYVVFLGKLRKGAFGEQHFVGELPAFGRDHRGVPERGPSIAWGGFGAEAVQQSVSNCEA